GYNKKLIATDENFKKSIILRGSSYIMIGLIFLLFPFMVLYTNLIIYPLAAGIAFSIFYTVSNVIVFESIGNKARGRMLGLYTSLIQIGVLIGAVFSGFISYYLGYWLDFVIAGIFVIMSLNFFKKNLQNN
ncbi:MAG: MFS transporter, partial [Thermoplasmata archaeon]